MQGKALFDLVELGTDLVRIQRHLTQAFEQLGIFFSQRGVLLTQFPKRGLCLGQLTAQLLGFRIVLIVRLFYVLHDVLAPKAAEPCAAEALALLVHL